jgi:hypothetical protein
MSKTTLIITIKPRLRCQYTHYCTRLTNKALIHTNGLIPVRWIMTPVCAQCSWEAVMKEDDYVSKTAHN